MVYGRVVLLRSSRKMKESVCSFPCTDPNNPLYTNLVGLKLTGHNDVVREMREREYL